MIKGNPILCIFGKHSGEVDHMESLGLETSFLIAVRRSLYEQGIGGNIGRWEEFAKTSTTNLIPFDHDFVYQKNDEIIMGRMWFSKDGKDRHHYPMVCCVHSPHGLLGNNFEHIQSLIIETENACRKSTSTDEIRSIFTKARGKLAEQVDSELSSSKPKGLSAALAFRKLYRFEAFGSGFDGLTRTLYAIEQTLTEKSLNTNTTVSRNHLGNSPLRIPILNNIQETLEVWLSVLKSQVDRHTMRTFLFPANSPWFDLILGDPRISEYICIKAPLDLIPYTHTELSIQPDQTFHKSINSKLFPVLKQESSKKVPRIIRIKRRQRDDDSKFGMLKSIVTSSIKEQKKDIQNKLWPRLLLASIVLIMFGIGIVFVNVNSGQGSRGIENQKQPLKNSSDQKWRKYNLAYHSWFSSFREDLSKNRRSAWKQHSELKKALNILENIEKEGKVMGPAKIMGVNVRDQTLVDYPSESVPTLEEQEFLNENFQAFREIEDILLGVKNSGFSFLERKQSQFESLGWEKPAEIVKLSKQNFQNPERSLSPLIAEEIDSYLEIKDAFSEIDPLLGKFLGYQKVIQQTEDKVLLRFCEEMKKKINRVNSLSELSSLLRKLSGVNSITWELENFIGQFWDRQNLDIDFFTRDSKIHHDSFEIVNEEVVRLWLDEVIDYQWLDPTHLDEAKQKWRLEFEQLNNAIAFLSESDCRNVESFILEKERLEKESKLNIPRVRKNKVIINNKMTRTNKEITQLIQEIENEKIKCSKDAREWTAIEKFNDIDKISSKNPSLNEEWNYWRTFYQSEFMNLASKGSNNSDHLALESRLTTILEFLRSMDKKEGFLDIRIRTGQSGLEPDSRFYDLNALINKRIMQRMRVYISKNNSLSHEAFEREISPWPQDLFRAVYETMEIEKLFDGDFQVESTNEEFNLEAIKEKLSTKKGWLFQLQSILQQDIRTILAEIPLEERPNSVVASFLWWETRTLEDWPRNASEVKYETQLRHLIKGIINNASNKYPHWAEELKTSLR